MNKYVKRVIEDVRAKNADQSEFLQAVEEVLTTLAPVLDKNPQYEENAILSYWAAIRSGDEIVGQWIRLLYEVILQGISDKRWFYDHQRASGALGFIERFCHHYKGKLAPGRIRLVRGLSAAAAALTILLLW